MVIIPIQQIALATLSKIVHYENLAVPAGLSTFDTYTIPTDEYYRLTQDALRYIGTVAGVVLYFVVVRGGVQSVVHNFAGITSNIAVGGSLNIIVMPGDILRVTVTAATLNDDLIADFFMERLHF